MMTHKSTQGSFCSPNKNDEENYQGETSLDSQENKKKYKIKKKNAKYKMPPRFEYPTSSIAARSQTHQEVPRTVNVPAVPTAVSNVSATYYPQYSQPQLGYGVAMHDWNHFMSAVRFHNPMYSAPYHPLPMTVYNPTPVPTTPVCTYNASMISPPMMPPIMPRQPPPWHPVYVEEMPMTANYSSDEAQQFSPEQIVPGANISTEQPTNTEANMSSDALLYDSSMEESSSKKDPIESYLHLPPELFPRAATLSVDPNPIIDELCKLMNLQYHLPWMLDLEFGIPKGLITRPIPIYDVKYNSIHCKNTPNAIHPGFESCSEDFKRTFLFYYDCVISAWYRGYVATRYDVSVEHFQEWLLVPMQVFGMCWP